MSFNSLDQLLETIIQQPGWEKYRQNLCLFQSWEKTVGEKIAAHTRPLYIKRNVLWVATSSSVWAQTLSMQRYSLLLKLNQQLPYQLTDLRFSTAEWHKPRISNSLAELNNHPSQVTVTNLADAMSQLPQGDTPKTAFQRWLQALKMRSQGLPTCPQCQAPTPAGEIERWGRCFHCASQFFSE